VTECRRDIALFSKQVVKIVDLALGVHVAGEAGRRSEGRDLEILSRAGSVVSPSSLRRYIPIRLASLPAELTPAC
jgi:hypothetical protein